MRAAAAALLTLADFETPLWIAPSFPAAVGDYLAFHTGAPRAAAPESVGLRLGRSCRRRSRTRPLRSGDGGISRPLDDDRRPGRVARRRPAPCRLSGPGIKGEAAFAASPLPIDFLAQWAANRAGFPLGVDLIFVADARLAALPRSTAIAAGAR